MSPLLSDPDLVYEKCLEKDEGFETALDLFPKGYRPSELKPEMSGK
jgi:DNA repair and recombination RAD54-like protein